MSWIAYLNNPSALIACFPLQGDADLRGQQHRAADQRALHLLEGAHLARQEADLQLARAVRPARS